jgi:hypothetical protein
MKNIFSFKLLFTPDPDKNIIQYMASLKTITFSFYTMRSPATLCEWYNCTVLLGTRWVQVLPISEVDFLICLIVNFLQVNLDRKKNSKTKEEKVFSFFSCLPIWK